MKNAIIICLSLAGFFIITAFLISHSSASLKVEIQGLRSSEGFVLLSLFKDGNGYPDEPEKAFRKIKISIKGKKASTDLADLPNAAYAIVVLHDENSNLKMDKSLGIPNEGYGFSNNVVGLMGPPSFSKASFRIEGNQLLEIKMRY